MDELLKDYRKITIIVGIVVLTIIFIVSIFFIKIHFDRTKVDVVHYEDESNLSYKVELKENEYYEDSYVEQENQYISNLINNIEANFEYELKFKEELAYNYDYEIIATANVSDTKTGKTIYEVTEPIVEKVSEKTDAAININEEIDIDYNKYNELMKKFVTQYDLDKVDSNLNVKMNVNVYGVTKEFEKLGISGMALTIPLTTNTVPIDMKYDMLNEDKIIEVKINKPINKTWFMAGCITMFIDFILLLALIIYVKKTETEEDKYNSELRKIVNTYDSYISRIKDEFNMEGYQILKVASFCDLLEIRDTMHVPIIMLGNEEQYTTCFMIPAPNNILYFFSIGVTQYALPVGKDENIESVSVGVSADSEISEVDKENEDQTV